VRIVSWNINSINTRIEHLRELISKENPDIILLQEIKCEEAGFPYFSLSDFGYEIAISGQKSYNGVAIFSKYKIISVEKHFPNNPLIDHARFIEIKCNTILGLTKVVSLYAPNGGEVGSHKFEQKLSFYKEFGKYLDKLKINAENIIIGGDFNIAPFDIDVSDPISFKNSTGFTLIEKKIMRTILNKGFYDLYRIRFPNAKEFSWWDYREGAFEQNKGMRIDFIISNSIGADHLANSTLLKEYRAKIKPSDHIPLMVEFKDAII
jgi:exodeoxyribonuclease-3